MHTLRLGQVTASKAENQKTHAKWRGGPEESRREVAARIREWWAAGDGARGGCPKGWGGAKAGAFNTLIGSPKTTTTTKS